jgi:hypothetical protein
VLVIIAREPVETPLKRLFPDASVVVGATAE